MNDDGESYSVTGIGTCEETDLVIPSAYNNLPVTAIKESAFIGCRSLTSIVVPDSVTSIGKGAFSGCSSLESITLPFVGSSSGVPTMFLNGLFGYIFGHSSYVGGTETKQYYGVDHDMDATNYIPTSLTIVTITGGILDYGAFYNCGNLVNINLSASVTTVGEHVFKNCTSLQNIEVDENNPNYMSIDGNLYTKDEKTLILYASGKQDTFFVVPNTVTTIGNYAFFDCDSLTGVTIANSLTSIGDYAFSGCSSLTSMTIPNSVTSIGSHAFNECASLAKVVIPSSVKYVGKYAFRLCNALTIYCEASPQSGWDSKWNPANCPIVRGYTET